MRHAKIDLGICREAAYYGLTTLVCLCRPQIGFIVRNNPHQGCRKWPSTCGRILGYSYCEGREGTEVDVEHNITAGEDLLVPDVEPPTAHRLNQDLVAVRRRYLLKDGHFVILCNNGVVVERVRTDQLNFRTLKRPNSSGAVSDCM